MLKLLAEGDDERRRVVLHGCKAVKEGKALRRRAPATAVHKRAGCARRRRRVTEVGLARLQGHALRYAREFEAVVVVCTGRVPPRLQKLALARQQHARAVAGEPGIGRHALGAHICLQAHVNAEAMLFQQGMRKAMARHIQGPHVCNARIQTHTQHEQVRHARDPDTQMHQNQNPA